MNMDTENKEKKNKDVDHKQDDLFDCKIEGSQKRVCK